MTSWLRELPDAVFDKTHVLLSLQDFDSLDTYESTYPTNPSPGRIYKTYRTPEHGRIFVVQESQKPGYVDHVPYIPLVIT